MVDIVPSTKPPTLTNSQLLTALSHPTRTALLQILQESTKTPKDLAQELGCAIRHVEYHLGILEKLGCINRVKTERTPGGKVIAHHYHAPELLWFDRDSWKVLDSEKRPGITTNALRLMDDDMRQALLAGTIDEGENHISRTPLRLDAAGYEDLVAVLAETLDRVVEIQAEAQDRLESDATPILTKVHIVQFISPDPR